MTKKNKYKSTRKSGFSKNPSKFTDKTTQIESTTNTTEFSKTPRRGFNKKLRFT